MRDLFPASLVLNQPFSSTASVTSLGGTARIVDLVVTIAFRVGVIDLQPHATCAGIAIRVHNSYSRRDDRERSEENVLRVVSDQYGCRFSGRS